MANDGVWMFVDDHPEAAMSFADQLNDSGRIRVAVVTPAEARNLLLGGESEPAGVLMDVDLSRIPGEVGTGPGIAQDIRTKQKAREAKEFPIVRFSAAEPWARNICGDPSSDDLFELSIIKDDFKFFEFQIVGQLIGLRELYDVLNNFFADAENPDKHFEKLFGTTADNISEWVHDGFVSKLLTGISHAPHVAAAVYCKLFLLPTGLLIDEDTLALRLGVDKNASGEAWGNLKALLGDHKYVGVGHANFTRWWARGMENWWFDKIDSDEPLSSRTVQDRVNLIEKGTDVRGLKAIQPPDGQTSTRYWRFCRLGLEMRPSELIPVDPSDAVRITSQVDMPSWVEPYVASPRLAFRAKHDARLNHKDMERLRKKYKVV